MSMRWIIPILLVLFSGCDKTPEIWDNLTVLKMAKEEEPSLVVMVPPSLDKPLIYCDTYTPPCKAGYKIVIKGMVMIPLEYKTVREAYDAARRINGYWVRNWAFDDTNGEPILERFVIKVFGAKKAREMEYPY
jgi:hypothetical protein